MAGNGHSERLVVRLTPVGLTHKHSQNSLPFFLSFHVEPPSFVTIFGGDNYRHNNYNHCKHGSVSFSSLQSKSFSGETPILSDRVRRNSSTRKV
ncbi:FAD synthetase [Salix suchowensis]|nr:FAD synthetase [Salix suchowensis]